MSLIAIVKKNVAQNSVGTTLAMTQGGAEEVAAEVNVETWLELMRYMAPMHSAMIHVSIPHQPAPITPRMMDGIQFP
jgi:hypothetical protein